MKHGQTIGQWLKWDFKTNGDLEIRDKNSNLIYMEKSNGYWVKWEWDSQGNEIYFEDSTGYWVKREWDSQGNEIYGENSNGYWLKWEWDSQGNEIYFEDSDGEIIDNRTPEVIEHNGRKYQLIP